MTGPSAKIFSLIFGAVYLAAFYVEWSPFRYYPETGHFHLTDHVEDGPAILWYGWLAVALVASGAASLLVPRRLAERISSDWVWAVSVALVVGIFVYEKRWFF